MPKFYSAKTGKIVETRFYRDAIKVNGLARVSEVSKWSPKQDLLIWQLRNVASTALDMCPVERGYDKEEMIDQIILAADAIRDDAASAGTAIHDFIEKKSLKNRKKAEQYAPARVIDRIEEETDMMLGELFFDGYKDTDQEFTIIDTKLGYGGRCDIRLTRGPSSVYIDWKTQNVKADKNGVASPSFYKSWVIQLAAYASANRKTIPPKTRIISAVIDRNTGALFKKEWNREDVLWGLRCFRANLAAYYNFHNINIKSILKNSQYGK